MKKIITLIVSVILVMAFFASCGKGDSTVWQSNVNETFENVVVYKYGDTVSAEFGSNCNIKINDNDYDHFVKYIEDLKAAGFEYVENNDIPENYNLSNGQANWRCTDGKVYLLLVFNQSDSSNYEMFGCNVQIYGYDQKPESWESKDDNTEEESTKSDKEVKNETTSEEK